MRILPALGRVAVMADESVATVDSTGLATGVEEGTAYITAAAGAGRIP